MAKKCFSVLVSAECVLPRTAQIMNDLAIDVMRIRAPVPRIYPHASSKKAFRLTHDERALASEAMDVFKPMAMWVVEREEFIWDDSDGVLPY